MYNFGQEFARAMERRMAWDLMERRKRDRSGAHQRLHAELAALGSGEVENPTEFQQNVQKLMEEAGRRLETLVEALKRPDDPEAVGSAIAEAVGGLMGETLALTIRVELLEWAVDG